MPIFKKKTPAKKATQQDKRDNRKENRQEVKEKVKAGVKKVAKKATSIIIKPYIPIMRKALGLSKSDKISNEELAQKFYDKFVRNSSYDEPLVYDFHNPENNTVSSNYSYFNQFENNFVDPITLSAIFTAIQTYFKNLKAKKAAGQPLSAGQTKVLDAADQAEVRIDEIADEETSQVIGETVQDLFKNPIFWGVVTVIVGAVAYLGFIKK